jgi:hypothetical protein
MDEQFVTVYLDVTSNRPQNETALKEEQELLLHRFQQRLPDAAKRKFELPPIILRNPSDPYLSLLTEARELFVVGYFYACVAMCGIVCERLVKDALRASLLVFNDGQVKSPSEDAFKQFENVDMSRLLGFLEKASVLDDASTKAARKLSDLRNAYAHARGSNPQKDAISAIKHLHQVVEGTISVFKEYELKDGAFVKKNAVG